MILIMSDGITVVLVRISNPKENPMVKKIALTLSVLALVY